MKRSLKIIIAAAAIMLCLLMTGCYNDDNTNTGTGNSGSITEYKPPFEVSTTPEPTAVVVEPDNTGTGQQQGITVVSNPTAAGSQQTTAAATATPTPTPVTTGDNAWDLWTPQATRESACCICSSG